MVHLLALLIFAASSAACWFLAVAAYRSTVAGHDPAATSGYHRIAGAAIALVALGGLVPFPTGLLLNLLTWAVAVFGLIAIPGSRRALLFAYLAVASVLERLVVLGVLDFTK